VNLPVFLALLFPLALLAYGLVALIKRLALRYNMLDVPNERSSHTKPTVRGGGAAIVAVTLLGVCIYAAAQPTEWARVLPFAAGGLIVAVLSGIDDLKPLSAKLRFGMHFGVALIAVVGLGYWEQITLPLVGTITLGLVGLPLTLLWIVGLTNAYNFMDGIDGIAGGQAVVAGLGWLVLAALHGGIPALVGVVGLLIAASSLGFLGHNWSPASIFMGDVSSAFLGYSFAVLPLFAPAGERAPLAFAAALLVWAFLLDAGVTFLYRLVKRENVFAAHRKHFYQRMTQRGVSHRDMSALYMGLAGLGVLAAVLWLG
jgi:UDP-N-acetylmuramyl pentapeptide phosphotransferase/UDP-N-acetylglucosamine-1-phosphate transferase